MPLLGVKADKTEKASNVRFRKGDNSDIVLFTEFDADTSEQRLSEQEALAEIERFKQEYNLHDVEFEAYETERDSGYFGEQASNTAKGAHIRGKNKVLIFYGRLSTPADLRRTLRHEALIHLALSRKNTVFRKNVINLLINSIYHDKHFNQILFGKGEKLGVLAGYKNRDVSKKSEEVLAFLSHREIQAARVKKALFKINSILRSKLNLNIRLSVREAQGIITQLSDV